jgi:hypothetical protein
VKGFFGTFLAQQKSTIKIDMMILNEANALFSLGIYDIYIDKIKNELLAR